MKLYDFFVHIKGPRKQFNGNLALLLSSYLCLSYGFHNCYRHIFWEFWELSEIIFE